MPEKTDKVLSERLAKIERAVIPGFYGAKEDGTIKTFSRGVLISQDLSFRGQCGQPVMRTGPMSQDF